MTTEDKQDDGAPKKEAKAPAPPPPPPPAEVTSAFVILRGVIASVVGAPIGGDSAASLLQATYLKEKGKLSGKFSVSLGKKQGTLCEADIPEETEGEEEFWKAVEAAANRTLSENLPLVCRRLSRAAIDCKYGNLIWDAAQVKAKRPKMIGDDDDWMFRVVLIDGLMVAVVGDGHPVVAHTGLLPRITIERGAANHPLSSSVSAGKKARKCEVAVKFVVEGEASTDLELATDVTDGDLHDIPPTLLESKIRCEEGVQLTQALAEMAGSKQPAAPSDARDESDSKPAVEEKPDSAQAGSDKSAGDGDAEEEGEEEMVVNAFEVKGAIDYNKLVDDFGSKVIDEDLLKRFERLTVGRGKVPYLHRFLRRNIFFSHRDLDKICSCLEKDQPMYLYTGRGPSSSAMHLGHLVPFLFTQWLQQALDCPLVIQMTDDEKFLFKGTYEDEEGDNLNYFAQLTVENAKDIIACGFNQEKTFLFSDLQYVGAMYPNIVRIWKAVTTNAVQGIFGFDGTSNIGKVAFPAVQAAPSFASSFPLVLNAPEPRSADQACLIPCAIDQDPYFRMTRDIAHKLVNAKTHPLQGKPALIHSKFFPPLQGATGKMSSSDENSAIFLTDTASQIEKKIKAHAFSGGQDTKEKQLQLGANLDVDVSYQWLHFFLEDDEELERIGREYGSGTGEYWSTGTVKKRLITVLQDLVKQHQHRRAQVTDEVVKEWMKERSLVGQPK